MKITNLSLVFVIIAVCIFIPIDQKMNNLNAISRKKVEYNNKLDNAVDDAVQNLIDYDSGEDNSYALNKDLVIQKFYQSLYAGFHASDNPIVQEELKRAIPLILLMDNDGFYIYYKDIYKDVYNNLILTELWTEKIPYVYDDGRYLYCFTFSTYLKMYDKEEKIVAEGEMVDLKDTYPDSSLLQDDIYFDEIRRLTITETIMDRMIYYMDHYNVIGNQFGYKYDFFLPATIKDQLERTIDNISMFVIFQNYPYGYGTDDVYNRLAFGAARLKKKELYYITEDYGKLFYHREGCDQVIDQSQIYYNKKDCAKMGAYPCEKCNP